MELDKHIVQLSKTANINNVIFFLLLSDRECHGHNTVVYKSHFPPLRHCIVIETPAIYLASKPCLCKGKALWYHLSPQHDGSPDLK